MKVQSAALIGLLTSLLAWAAPARAIETIVDDEACRSEGLPRPLRQTLILIDQSIIESAPTGDVGDNNRKWINKVLSIAGVQEGQTASIAAPRERLSVVVAREDGGDLVRIFTGCSPTYSQAEVSELKRARGGLKGSLQWFIGADIEHQIEGDQKKFRSKLTEALANLPKLRRSKNEDQDDKSQSSYRRCLFFRALSIWGRGPSACCYFSNAIFFSARC